MANWKALPKETIQEEVSETLRLGYSVKRCCACKEMKPLQQFSRHKAARFGVAAQCKNCSKEYAQRRDRPVRRIREHGSKRDWLLKKRFGISEAQYRLLLSLQGELCAICGEQESAPDGQNMHVDHDHATDSVRGILCFNCNVALGYLKDDPERLWCAMEYLKNPPAAFYEKELSCG